MGYSDSDLNHIAGVVYIEVIRREKLDRIADGQRTMIGPGAALEDSLVKMANDKLQTEQKQIHAIAEVLRRYID